MNGGKIEDIERSSVGGDTSRVEDNVWIRAIIEETLGDVEGCARRYFPRPLGTPILYLSREKAEIRAEESVKDRLTENISRRATTFLFKNHHLIEASRFIFA